MAKEIDKKELKVKPIIEYGKLIPGEDYVRTEVNGSIDIFEYSALPPEQQAIFKAVGGLNKVMNCDDVLESGLGKKKWEKKVFLVVNYAGRYDVMDNWTEVEFLPVLEAGEKSKDRPGFVLRLDPWSGKQILVSEDGKPEINRNKRMMKKGWSYESVTELKNKLGKLSGKTEQEVIVPRDPSIDRVIDNREYYRGDIARAVVGKDVTDKDLHDPNTPITQALAGACMLAEMAFAGADNTHILDHKFLGLGDKSVEGHDGKFQESPIKTVMTNNARRLRAGIENGQVIDKQGEIRMADTQGYEWVVTNKRGGYEMYLERVTIKNDFLPINKQVDIKTVLAQVGGQRSGEYISRPGWHGDQEDRHYQETRVIVNGNTSLYENGLPVPLLNAVVCLEFHNQLQKFEILSWTETNSDELILVNGNITTWKELRKKWKQDYGGGTEIGQIPENITIRKRIV